MALNATLTIVAPPPSPPVTGVVIVWTQNGKPLPKIVVPIPTLPASQTTFTTDFVTGNPGVVVNAGDALGVDSLEFTDGTNFGPASQPVPPSVVALAPPPPPLPAVSATLAAS